MDRSFRWMAALALSSMTLVMGCAQREQQRLPDSVLNAWTIAFNSGNVEAVLDMYTIDAELLPPNEDKVMGHEGVLKIFGAAMRQGLKATQTTDSVVVRDDLAVRSGAYTLSDRAGAEIDHGKYVEVWRRNGLGVWKMSHDVWNSSKPAVATAVAAPSQS